MRDPSLSILKALLVEGKMTGTKYLEFASYIDSFVDLRKPVVVNYGSKKKMKEFGNTIATIFANLREQDKVVVIPLAVRRNLKTKRRTHLSILLGGSGIDGVWLERFEPYGFPMFSMIDAELGTKTNWKYTNPSSLMVQHDDDCCALWCAIYVLNRLKYKAYETMSLITTNKRNHVMALVDNTSACLKLWIDELRRPDRVVTDDKVGVCAKNEYRYNKDGTSELEIQVV